MHGNGYTVLLLKKFGATLVANSHELFFTQMVTSPTSFTGSCNVLGLFGHLLVLVLDLGGMLGASRGLDIVGLGRGLGLGGGVCSGGVGGVRGGVDYGGEDGRVQKQI